VKQSTFLQRVDAAQAAMSAEDVETLVSVVLQCWANPSSSAADLLEQLPLGGAARLIHSLYNQLETDPVGVEPD
jgi:hypothetical protein